MADSGSEKLHFHVAGLTRRFGTRTVFRGVNFECRFGESVCITGSNGSGKTTLLRIAAGLLIPSSGDVTLTVDGEIRSASERRQSVRLVSPESNLYDELTAYENLAFFSRVSGKKPSAGEIESVLVSVGLAGRGGDFFGEYSSGMKQRLKLAAALMSRPPLLLLDEPSSNLDQEGRELVYRLMEEQVARGALIYSTNEQAEQRMGDTVVRLG